eukprot:COSAG05_NODE_1024_length_6123_cov_7.197709_4_plen_191_part_00
MQLWAWECLGRRGKADPGSHPVRATPEAAENRLVSRDEREDRQRGSHGLQHTIRTGKGASQAHKRHQQIPQSVSQAEFEVLTHGWRDLKWLVEFLRELGLGKFLEQPIAMIGDNRNARDWAMEDVMADGNRHFEHKYFTIRERVELGEVKIYWILGKDGPKYISGGMSYWTPVVSIKKLMGTKPAVHPAR